jgi:general secretion pathway protein I
MIEALVAIALVAITLGAIGSLVASSLTGVRKLEQRVALMETTRLIAADIARIARLQDNASGELSGHRWQMRLAPFFDGGPIASDPGWSPQRVIVRVQSPSGAIMAMETIRLSRVGRQ